MLGSLSLRNAKVTSLVDHESCWPVSYIEIKGEKIATYISLDGFTYDRFSNDAPTDAGIRKKWLLRQRPSHITESFRPQPFEQLTKVLREMGHDGDARRIAMFKQSCVHRRKSFWKQPLEWTVGWLWGVTCGFGYRPIRPFVALLFLWLVCGFVYKVGGAYGGFAPRDAQVWTNPLYKDCAANWTTCANADGGVGKVSEIIAFDPFLYSADTLLPAIDLGQRSAWAPMWRSSTIRVPLLGPTDLPKGTLRTVAWIENVLGVGGVILIGAILSGIVKLD
jgi:hypothetical protein